MAVPIDRVVELTVVSPENQRTFITGLAVDPGDAGILHHSVVYAMPQAKVASYLLRRAGDAIW